MTQPSPTHDIINPALTDLASRIGDLLVANALLVAENRALLARIEQLTADPDTGVDAPS